jgi:hypothetical protein
MHAQEPLISEWLVTLAVPNEHFDNSPQFQLRVCIRTEKGPEGTTESSAAEATVSAVEFESGGERRTPDASRSSKVSGGRASVWSAVTSAPLCVTFQRVAGSS